MKAPLCVFAASVFALPLAGAPGPAANPDEILLKDYLPKSIFNIPQTRVETAKYPVLDAHSHNYARTDADVDRWVRTMDQVGVQKTVILSGNTPTYTPT
jgi:uncharacterized protein